MKDICFSTFEDFIKHISGLFKAKLVTKGVLYMPVPKKKELAYSVIVGNMQNKGKSLSAAKKIADRAMKSKRLKLSSFKKYSKKK